MSFSGFTQSVIDRVKERSRRPVQSSRNRSDRAAITFHRRPRALTALSVLPDQVMNLILARCRSPRQGRKSSTWTSIDRG